MACNSSQKDNRGRFKYPANVTGDVVAVARARRCGVRREQPITRRRVVLLITIGRAGRLLLEESVVSHRGGRNREPLNSPSQYAAAALVMISTYLPRSHQSRLGDDIGGDSCCLAEASPLQ